MTEESKRTNDENETYRKFFVLNMAYTRAQPYEDRPAYVNDEMNCVYKDFDLAVQNSNSFIEHGMENIYQILKD